jgi:ubiquinol-cytochrome c reductase iron-sulfur subunit
MSSLVKHSTPEPVANFDSSQYDTSFDKYQRDTTQGDATGRNQAYFVLGGARLLYASMARLTLIKVVASMSASADVLAMSQLEIPLAGIPEGQSATFKWRGKPVFVRHRTQAEIDIAVSDDTAELRDNQTDAERVQDPKWMVVLGICTHLGCVPIGYAGEHNGWFCPCHGSHYDTSGRIRKGPAPLNLEVPEYKFIEDGTKLLVG